MANGYDGSIRIDTRIDERGFNTGIKSLTRTLRNFAGVVGVAFGIGAVVKFGATAVSQASALASALTGLQSVVQGQGKSFSAAKSFIDDYISDGLVPATNAITAYKNLALRGYDTSQIQETMTILKDTAAFGRQASLSMGDAVQSATEGLKNENSILVDNAGVTKNVAKMWQDYARSHGLSVASLTQEQKIEAELIGLRQESIFQTGDAAKMADTYAGKVAGLSNAFYKLKVGVGNVFIPILQKIIPVVTTIVNWLTALANRAAQVIQILLGVKVSAADMSAYADEVNSAADAQDNLAGATEKSGKAAKGALAPFDELNVLQQDTGNGDAGGVSVGDLGGLAMEEEGSLLGERLDGLTEKIEGFKVRLATLFKPSEGPFERVKGQVSELGGKIWNGLEWAWNNILVPIGEWTIGDALPVFLDLFSEGLEVLNGVLDALKPLGIWLWEEFLQPLGGWAAEGILADLGSLENSLNAVSNWISANQGAIETIAIIIGSLAAAWWLVNTAVTAWNVISALAATVTTAFGTAMAFLTSPIGLVILAIAAIIAIIVLLVKNWDWVKEKASEVWSWIVGVWNGAGDWFKSKVTEPIKNAFKTALDWIGEKWETVFTGVKDFVKGVINSIIDFINGMISAVIKGINAIIAGINAISISIPNLKIFGEWAGTSFGFNIPSVSAPRIPRLAAGAAIPPNSAFAAILGDQRSGYNLEGPEDRFRQIVREELAGMIGNENIDITMPVYLDSEKIYEGQQRVQRRRGNSLVVGGGAA